MGIDQGTSAVRSWNLAGRIPLPLPLGDGKGNSPLRNPDGRTANGPYRYGTLSCLLGNPVNWGGRCPVSCPQNVACTGRSGMDLPASGNLSHRWWFLLPQCMESTHDDFVRECFCYLRLVAHNQHKHCTPCSFTTISFQMADDGARDPPSTGHPNGERRENLPNSVMPANGLFLPVNAEND